MSEEQYDEWGLSESGPLGAGEVSITSASFGYDAQYKNGEQELAILEGTVIGEDGESHPWRQFYSVGAGWSVVDGGSRVERADGRKKNFQKQSKYGMLIAAALESGAGEVLRGRGPATSSKVWEGLRFEFAAKEHDYGGDIGKKSTLVPVKYLGEGTGSSTGTPAASSPTAQTPASNGAASGTVSPALKAKLKKLALESDTHDAFIDGAFLIDGVDGNAAVENLVADSPAFYLELRG